MLSCVNRDFSFSRAETAGIYSFAIFVAQRLIVEDFFGRLLPTSLREGMAEFDYAVSKSMLPPLRLLADKLPVMPNSLTC